MPSRLAASGVLLEIAFRNLFASRAKTLIIGGIIMFGTGLVVVGGAVIDGVDVGMRKSIQGSIGGHLQVYNANSRDELALFGGAMGESDLQPLEDFAEVKKVLLSVPNVRMVIPLGLKDAIIDAPNTLDRTLAKLRDDVRAVLAGDKSTERATSLAAHKAHVRHIIELLASSFASARSLAKEGRSEQSDREALARVQTDAFWRELDTAPLPALEFLENRIAPQSIDGGMTFIRYAGTDLDAFPRAFDRMHIIEGTAVPPGQRGILLAKLYSEEMLKLRTARRLDKIKEQIEIAHVTIAKDEQLQRFVKENVSQTRDVMEQLNPMTAQQATERLARALRSSKTALADLLVELFETTDANFLEHYAIFYRELAPLLELYRIKVGDTLTIKAFTSSGYMKSVNVKVYGIYSLAGLEKSMFAGMTSLMDLMTFRDLYGYMTAERAAEIKRLKAGSGAREVNRDNAEAELFGGGEAVVGATKAQGFDENTLMQAKQSVGAGFTHATFTQDELEHGVVLNAAVLLHDESQMDATMGAIDSATKAAGLPLKVVTWQVASGLVGKFVTFARVILWVAVLIIFAVALVIINNAMVMATLQRVGEIGTLRAIGAQRRFTFFMLLAETVAVGLAFGGLGAGLGAGVVALLRATGGFAARSDEMYFFFSGPALMPAIGVTTLVIALVLVLIVSILSGVYPAMLAGRVTPILAMQTED